MINIVKWKFENGVLNKEKIYTCAYNEDAFLDNMDMLESYKGGDDNLKKKLVDGLEILENFAEVVGSNDDKEEFDEFDMSDIFKIIEVSDKSQNDNKDDNTKNVKNESHKNVKNESHKNVKNEKSDVTFFPFDDLMTVRKKIQLITSIPLYKQHITTGKNPRTNSSIPYKFVIDDIEQPINLQDFIKLKNSSLELINNNYVKSIDDIKIYAYDQFILLKMIDNLVEINVYNLDDFIDNNINKEYIDIFYYGFVIAYFPISTYEIFKNDISGSNIQSLYPELHPDNKNLQKLFKYQDQINSNLISHKKLRKLEEHIDININKTTFIVKNYLKSKINLRNLFDFLRIGYTKTLGYEIVYVKYKEPQGYTYTKTYRGEQINTEFIHSNECIICIKYDDSIAKSFKTSSKETSKTSSKETSKTISKIKQTDDVELSTKQNIIIIMQETGSYEVKTHWKDDIDLSFNKIEKIVKAHVNPFIDIVNNLIVVNGSKIPYLTDIKMKDMNININWGQKLTITAMKKMRELLDNYKYADIIDNAIYINNQLNYYYKYGMNDYDISKIERVVNIKNYYEYLSNNNIREKWSQFTFNRVHVNFIKRTDDLKIEITNSTDLEFNRIYLYICSFIDNNINEILKYNNLDNDSRKKDINYLKELDPMLFDFQKYYNVKDDTVYSKICQKPHQPLPLTESEYNKMDKSTLLNNKRTIKYWNFSRNEPIYYTCPNSKFPFLHFITGVHPKNFCLPCCKKIPAPDLAYNNLKYEITNKKMDPTNKIKIHRTCVNDLIYDDIAKHIEPKYVMQYGKELAIGRIGMLPENTLKTILSDNISEPVKYDSILLEKDIKNKMKKSYITNKNIAHYTDIIENDDLKNIGMFLYGTKQTSNLSNAGVAYIICDVLNITYEKFIEKIKIYLRSDKTLFNNLLNGSLSNYFLDMEDLIYNMEKDFTLKFRDWSDLFLECLDIFNLIPIVFLDDKTSNIKLLVSKNINTIYDLFNDSTKDVERVKYILILKQVTGKYSNSVNTYDNKLKSFSYNYLPIYKINTEMFFSKLLENKRFAIEYKFDIESDIMENVVNLYDFILKESNKKKLELMYLYKVLNTTNFKKYTIKEKFYNKDNFCYGVIIEINSSKTTFYIPVNNSKDKKDDRNHTNDKILSINDIKNTNAWDIHNFIKAINEHIISINNKYSHVEKNTLVYSNLIMFDNYYIGIIINNLYCYFDKVKNIKELPRSWQELPIQLFNHHPIEVNNNISKIDENKLKKNQSYYRGLYKIYLYDLILYSININLHKERNNKMRNLIEKNIRSLDNIKEIDQEDREFINSIIVRYNNSETILDIIDKNRFNFDNVTVNEIKDLLHLDSSISLKKRLSISKDLINNVTIISQLPNDFVFPNIFNTCDSKNLTFDYCKNNKIIISKDDFDNFVKVMADDMNNNYKLKFMFDNKFYENVINKNKFSTPIHEQIIIS